MDCLGYTPQGWACLQGVIEVLQLGPPPGTGSLLRLCPAGARVSVGRATGVGLGTEGRSPFRRPPSIGLYAGAHRQKS
eukprot:14948270-Alexandrium_andersonii.AAC.1